MSENSSVAVIGGGVIGLNTAYQLQKNGFAVTIFDGNGLASESSASFGNAGHFATEQMFPLADPALLSQLPKMLLDPLGPFKIKANYFAKALPWFMRFLCAMGKEARVRNGLAIKALNQRSIKSWRTLVTELGCEELLQLKGSLLTYEGASSNSIHQDLTHYRAQDVEVNYVSGESLSQLAPGLASTVTGALHFTQVGHTPSPVHLCQNIADAFLRLGGNVQTSHVSQICGDNGIVISSENRSTRFDKVVICAGAHSKILAKQLGYNVPLETERGYHLMLPIKTDLTMPVASSDRKFIMTPMADGLRLAGTVEFGGLDNAPDFRRSDMLLTHAKAMLCQSKVVQLVDITLQQLKQEARWMGFRPSLPDSLPIIDKSPSNPNVLFNFGHQHLGLTWGAISGELIRDLVLNQPTKIDVSPYRISRF